MRYLLFFSFLLLFVVPTQTLAETVVRTGESVSVSNDQRVESDFYAAANVISMSGIVDGDMYALGGTITINGNISADLTTVGGATQVHATVTDDVRVIGGEVVLAEAVGGDVFVIGGILKILSSASVAGDVYFFGGEVDVAGPIGGSLVGIADSVRVDSAVQGDIDMTVGSGLTLGSKAEIGGDVKYKSTAALTRAPEAVVVGDVVANTQSSETNEFDGQGAIVFFLITLFSVLTVYLFGRTKIAHQIVQLPTAFGATGLIGLGALLVTPAVALLLVFTVLGSLLGMALLFIWLASVFLALLLSPIVAGSLLWYSFKKEMRLDLTTAVSGVVIVQALLYLPFVGSLILFGLLALTLGSLVQFVRSRL